jgi:hypothetical protein
MAPEEEAAMRLMTRQKSMATLTRAHLAFGDGLCWYDGEPLFGSTR